MGYYMSELYRRYFRATDFSELEEEIENTRQEVRDCLDQAQRRELMRLVDAQDQLKANLTLDTYTHVTGDMQRGAAEIVGGFLTELLGEELEPWQRNENGEMAVST